MKRRAAALAATALALACGSAWAAFPESPPNDPLFDANPLPNATNEQWDLQSPGGGFDRGISADRAWALSTGEGALIADVDVGVEFDHPDVVNRWYVNEGEAGAKAANGEDDDGNGFVDDWRGWDFYEDDNNAISDTQNAHGINVAGVLGAEADNGIGIAGVAPGARILPVRTSDNIIHQGVRLERALRYSAERGADAISMSLGADTFTAGMRDALRDAHERGAVIAVASGNEFHFHHHYPQMSPYALAVGGINPDTANVAAPADPGAVAATDFTVHASYANYGPHLDVVAPTQVPTTEWGGGYRLNWSGTSAATPHVAAVAGLVAARGKKLGLRLSAGEVMQIIRQSADDLSDTRKGYKPGWDLLSGWGRVNAFEAVRRVEQGRIPPVALIESPDPYRPAARSFEVAGAAHGRTAVSWELEIGTGEDPQEWRQIGAGGSTPGEGARLATVDPGELAAGGYTLRLRATDADGNVGEDRGFFYALGDPALRPGYPKRLGTSGEASPALADLNGDGGQDIVLATSDGKLRVYSGRTGRFVRGWPRKMPRGPWGRLRSGLLSTPAVGDVSGDGQPDVVAPGLDGRIHAWSARGRRLRGFPYRLGITKPIERGRLDAAVYASPALADLSGDGRLDIVVGGSDQRVHALDGRGRALPGWPVLARDSEGGDPAKILSSPAVGDLNGDGSLEVVEGTAEVYGSPPSTSGRVYAFSADGKRLPGWPIAPPALAADAIPLAGEGVPVSPSLADVDGDGRDEVAVAAFTGQPELYRGDGSRMSRPGAPSHFRQSGRGGASRSSASEVLALGGNGAFGRTAPDGALRFFGGVVDGRLVAAQSSPATPVPFEHLLGGWDARSGDWLSGFPAPVEGWTIAAAPTIADVDGEGGAEALAGSSGNILHAFREDGSEPPGWPKQTGGWLIAAPAVGDLDADGRSDVVAVTRDGYLFAWRTSAPEPERPEWPSFRHDVHNTGRYGGPAVRETAARPVRLRLRLRCAGPGVRASVVGRDRRRVRRVVFRAGGRRLARDRSAPFSRRVRTRPKRVRARVLLRGGRRVTLRPARPRCAR